MIKFVVAITTVIFVKLFNTLTGKQISVVRPERIGHLVGEIDIYLRERKRKLAPDNLIIITGKPCNAEVVKLYKRYTTIISSRFLYKCLDIMRRQKILKNSLYSLHMTTLEYEIFDICPNIVELNTREKQRGYDEIKNLYGMKESDWWVCFHSRDANYLNVQSNKDFTYHNFRDFEIEDMLPAMEEVTKRGGYAIRFGSNPIKKLQTDNPKIIDYSFNGQSDFLDIFLCSEAKFFIGNTSGPFHLPKLFDTPYAICNLLGYGHMSPLPASLFIPKILSDQNGKRMTFEECAKLGMFDEKTMSNFYSSKSYQDHNIKINNNSPSEILGLTKDMFDLVNSKTVPTAIKLQQRQFKDRFYSMNYDRHSAGNIAPSFLKLNSNLF